MLTNMATRIGFSYVIGITVFTAVLALAG